MQLELQARLAYIKERDRLVIELKAYKAASRTKSRFTEYYKRRISYLEDKLIELDGGLNGGLEES